MIRLLPCFAAVLVSLVGSAQTIPASAAIDQKVAAIMAVTHANGMAVAVVDHGSVGYVQAYGIRDAKGEKLDVDTMMYGASLTKTVFAYTVMQLVDQGKLKLDTPIKDDLDKPLPSYGLDPVFPDKYGPYKDLADDPRWEKITPRMCLTHSTGFANFWFIEPDQKLHIHFDPGTHFSYSGEGLILLQFAIEHGRTAQGLGIDEGDVANADFKRLGMTRTSLVFLNGTETNVADGWNDKGEPQEHSQRKKVRAAGSMNTTISDFKNSRRRWCAATGLARLHVRR
jgi:CubicO group peptidase (beta-lactamase class C family)